MVDVVWCTYYRYAVAILQMQGVGGKELDVATHHAADVYPVYLSHVPLEADLVFDVRFLPNPFYVPELKHKTGMDSEVYDYVFSFPQTKTFIDKLEGMLSFLLPLYAEEGKSTLVIAVGCTGGHHRSVSVARCIASYLTALGYPAFENHRDITRG